MTTCAVVGHVEWIEFVRVEGVPDRGHIVTADEAFFEAAGGGGVAAVQLHRLGAEVTLYTALGDDEIGRRAKRRLEELGVQVEAEVGEMATRRGFTFLDSGGERTITVIGPKLVPRGEGSLRWEGLDGTDAVYFTAGDAAVLREARRARVLVATSRELPTLQEAGVRLDALVGSGSDPGEAYAPGDLDPPPELWVATDGARGGSVSAGTSAPTRYEAVPLPGPIGDAYGCGDSFAAGLTFGLGEGRTPRDALALGARCGAECLTGRGPYGVRLTAA